MSILTNYKKKSLSEEEIERLHAQGFSTIGPGKQRPDEPGLTFFERAANVFLPKPFEFKPDSRIQSTIKGQQRAAEEVFPERYSIPVRLPFAEQTTFNIPKGDAPMAVVATVVTRLPELVVSIPVNAVNFFRKNLNSIYAGLKNRDRDTLFSDPVYTQQFNSIFGMDPRRFGLPEEAMTDTVSEMFRQVDKEEQLNPGGAFNIEKAISKTVLIDVIDVLFAKDILGQVVPTLRLAARQLPDNLLFKIQTSRIPTDEIIGSLTGAKITDRANRFISSLSNAERKDLWHLARSYEKAGQSYIETVSKTPSKLGEFAGAKVPAPVTVKSIPGQQLPGIVPTGPQTRFAVGLSTQQVREVGRVTTQIAVRIEGLTNKVNNLQRLVAMNPLDDEMVKELAAVRVDLANLKKTEPPQAPLSPLKEVTPSKPVTKPVTKEVTELVTLAKKFETLEEFVKAQGDETVVADFLSQFDDPFSVAKEEGVFAPFQEGTKGLDGRTRTAEQAKFGESLEGVKATRSDISIQVADFFRKKGEPVPRIDGKEQLNMLAKDAIEFGKDAGYKEADIAYYLVRNYIKGGIEFLEGGAKPVLPQTTTQLTEIFNKAKATTVKTQQLPPEKKQPPLKTSLPAIEAQPIPKKVPVKAEPKELKDVQLPTKKIVAKPQQKPSKLPPDVSLPKPTTQSLAGQADRLLTEPSFQNTVTVQNSWGGIFELPPETRGQAFRRTVEDMNIRLKILNNKIEEAAGNKLPEHFNLWAQKDMLPRKQSDLLRRIRDEKVDFVKRLVDAKVDLEKFDEYLHARHAIERNAEMNRYRASINKKPENGLSGMTDAEATKILAQDNSKFVPFENEVRKMSEDTLDFMVNQGLLKQEQADLFRKTYKNYVPLFRQMEDDFTGIGAGISTPFKEIKRAKGSKREITSPLGNIFYRKERALIIDLKNKVGTNLIDIVEEYPFLKDIIKVEKEPVAIIAKTRSEVDPDEIIDVWGKIFRPGPNVIIAKREGSTFFITIKDQMLARSLKNLNLARIPRWAQFFRATLGVWSGLKTRLRPEFLVTNFERDLGEALINLGVERAALGKGAKHLKAKVVKGLFPSQRQMWKYLRGGSDPVADEFFKLGGDAGHFWLVNAEETTQNLYKLERQLKNNGIERIKNPVRKAGQLVDDINSMVELGVRFSAYKELLKAGMSKQSTIQAVADMTINFSRQGEFSPVLKSLYGFINPTIQGTSKVVRTITSKTGRRRVLQAVVALVGLGYMVRMISYMMDPEGDERISEWDKNHRMAFSIGGGNTIKLWNMPYGYTAFYSLGSNMAELTVGTKNTREASTQILDTVVNSFSPFGTNLNDIIPTLLKPIFDINANKGWYDGEIHPEQVFTNTPKPNSSTYFKNASDTSIFITQFLNEISGGSDRKAGAIDISPNDLKYLYDQWIGGPFEFATSTLEAIATGAGGEFEPNKTPFVRQVYGEERTDSWSYGIIYDTLERAYKKEVSEMERNRFYRAVDVGLEEEIFDDTKANKYIQDFIKANYSVSGRITKEDAIEAMRGIPEDERERLINTYAESTQTKIRSELNKSSKKTRNPFNKTFEDSGNPFDAI